MMLVSACILCLLPHQTDIGLAIWDNRSVFHSAIMDFAGHGARTGHRAVGIGGEPYFDQNSKTRREALSEAGVIA